MRVILTGGGTGGHFYPLVAVARALRDLAERRKILNLELIYASNEPYDLKLLDEENIKFVKIPAGKMRRYFSIRNIFDPFVTFFGILRAAFAVYLNFPDVIFAKGGYASFPALVAGRMLKIPIIIHETDAVPGRVTLWASKFAKRVAISFPQAAKYFPSDKTALTGNPIRKEIMDKAAPGAEELFNLEPDVPVILVLGGSQGAQKMNDLILDVLKELLEFSQVIHQTGENNFAGAKARADLVLENITDRKRYHILSFLGEKEMCAAYGAAALIISRASGSIFEIAAAAVPAILIPLPSAAQDHQRENAYAYARAGGAEVLEEENLLPHVFLDLVKKLLTNEEKRAKMIAAAKNFAKPDAADKIADEIISLTVQHA